MPRKGRSTSISVRIAIWEKIGKMSVRPRSQSRERVVVKSEEFVSGEALDPMKFLADLIEGLNSFDIGIAVKLTDGISSAAYSLSTFVSKKYEVENGKVKFGYRKLNLETLRASITYEVYVATDD
jgi:hypothetical protein